ncbi:MAG: hypothetical protein CM1200mP27_02410 [Chloroflexota bacterium]|nr:MAG: hypothetical protein CM1200mP27_02410 [Chloroflexota bacterium]
MSTAVVGDNRNVRVHVHVEEPTAAVAYAESLGSVTDVNIEDMDSQATQFATGDHSPEPNGLAFGSSSCRTRQGVGPTVPGFWFSLV